MASAVTLGVSAEALDLAAVLRTAHRRPSLPIASAPFKGDHASYGAAARRACGLWSPSRAKRVSYSRTSLAPSVPFVSKPY